MRSWRRGRGGVTICGGGGGGGATGGRKIGAPGVGKDGMFGAVRMRMTPAPIGDPPSSSTPP